MHPYSNGIVLLLVCFLSAPQFLSGQVFTTESGHAEFTSSVPLHTFTGTSSNLTGMIDLGENLVDFFIDLNTMRTGIDRRDRDMFRTLDVETFPFAEFTGSLDVPFDENSTEEQTVNVTGEFTIHGVSREVTVEGTLQKSEEHIHLEAEWILDITDYEIEPPGILFYRVRDELDMRIEAVLQPASGDEL